MYGGPLNERTRVMHLLVTIGLDTALTEAINQMAACEPSHPWIDRKSTRLNSSHANISYAVFCLKKKKKKEEEKKKRKKQKINIELIKRA